jgi:hypothetical protein
MPVIIKTGPIAIDSAGRVNVNEPLFKDARIEVGDTAYLWVCETSRGEGLAMRGQIESVEETVTRHKRLGLRILDQRPNRPLGLHELRPLRNSPSTDPQSTLAKTLYKHSLRKIAELTPDEATYIDGFF